mmetsp:Transcript_6728/g.16153  ORF Transcript_6728/g.16153 Transcript_6728/m.16153 type:complete len:210 (-) Transcript_6728:121-750(-)
MPRSECEGALEVDDAVLDARDADERVDHRVLGQHVAPLLVGLVDQEAAPHQGRAALADQLDERAHHLARGEHVVHEQHAVARTDKLAEQVQRHGLLVLASRWPRDRVHDRALGGRRALRDGDHERELHGQRAVACEQCAAPRRDDLRRLQPGVVLPEAVSEMLPAEVHELAVHLVVDEGVQPKGFSVFHRASRFDFSLKDSGRRLAVDE